jgi:hypothetical protein
MHLISPKFQIPRLTKRKANASGQASSKLQEGYIIGHPWDLELSVSHVVATPLTWVLVLEYWGLGL